MTKRSLALFLVLSMAGGIFLLSPAIWAADAKPAPDIFLQLYEVEDKVLAVGTRNRLADNLLYGTINLEYHQAVDDLALQAGVAYFLPHQVLFFRFYGGVGLEFSRNEGYRYPYLMLGTDYLFLFSEVVYPLKPGEGPQYRGGFSFKF